MQFTNRIVLILSLLWGSIILAEEAKVDIHYLGHSAFVMQFDNGITVVTDYGYYNAWAPAWDSPIHDIGDLVPDVMTYSHDHQDHYDPSRIPPGVSHILTGMDSLTIQGITIRPVRTCENNIHVESNTSYIFTYKDLKICHLGDAQAQIMCIDTAEVKEHIQNIFPETFDLLFMTIEGIQQFIPQAETFVDLLKPKRIIPIHFWTQAYRQDFLDYLNDKNTKFETKYVIQKINGSKYSLSSSETVSPVKVISLKRGSFIESTGQIKVNQPLPYYELLNNYPNPFNPKTVIGYRLQMRGRVVIEVVDLKGHKVRTLVKKDQPAGIFSVEWDGRDDQGLPVLTGLYLYRLQTGIYTESKKMTLIK